MLGENLDFTFGYAVSDGDLPDPAEPTLEFLLFGGVYV